MEREIKNSIKLPMIENNLLAIRKTIAPTVKATILFIHNLHKYLRKKIANTSEASSEQEYIKVGRNIRIITP